MMDRRKFIRNAAGLLVPAAGLLAPTPAFATTFVNGVMFQANGGGTSAPVDMTINGGADFIFWAMTCAHNQMNGLKVSCFDSLGNTWALGLNNMPDGSGNADIGAIYKINPTIGSAMTFSFNGGSQLQSMCVAGYKRGNLGFDIESAGGNSLASFTVQPGTATPNQNNSLIMMVATAVQVAPTLSINQGFTPRLNQPLVLGQTYGCYLADLFQSTAAAVNPTLTSSSNANGMAARTYIFKGAPESKPFSQVPMN